MTFPSQKKAIVINMLAGVSLVTLAMASTAAQAQDAAGDETIEEIIVTAGRREQSLKDVPASVTAIVPEDFILRGLTDLKSMLQYVPGIRFDDGGNPGEGNISARGVPQSGATPVFGIYIDDTPLTSNSSFGAGAEVFFDGTLMDIERIEVIKGPQGTLYGATSVGGMLRYITRKPALEDYRVSAGVDLSTVAGGGHGYIENGRVSIPIFKNKLGITLSGYRQKTAGYIDFVDGTGDVLEKNVDGSKIWGYSADVLFVPTSALEIRLKYIKQEIDTRIGSSVMLAGPGSTEGLFSDFSTTAEPGLIFLDYEIMSGSFSYDFGGMTLTSTTSHSEYTSGQQSDFSFLAFLVDGFQPPGVTTTGLFLTENEGAKKTVQEVRLTSDNNEKLEWIAGFYYANEDTFTTQALDSIPVVLGLADVSFPSKYKEFAGFGDVTYYVTEKFDLTAGVRLSKSEISIIFFQSGPFVGPTIDFDGEIIKDTVATYLFAARYRVNDDISLYSRVASGYRPVQANLPLFQGGENIAGPIVESDNVWSYELGAKGTLADDRVDFDVSLWMIDWSNFQALFTTGAGITVSANAPGGLSAKGFEGSFVYRATPALTLMANIGFTDSHLNEDEPGIGGLKGVQYPGLPKWKGSVQWNYNLDLSSDWSGGIGGGLRYRGGFVSGFPASTTGGLAVKVDSGVLADVNVNLTNGRIGFGVYATNLFNNRSLNDRGDSSTPAPSTGIFERPRTFGFNIRADF